MSAVRTSGTSLELALATEFKRHRFRFEQNARDLRGKPDFVFRRARVVVFVDGDFWHGFRFPVWRDSLSAFWQVKIQKNRARDQRTFRFLRRQGWKVVRLWQHQVKASPASCAGEVIAIVRSRTRRSVTMSR